MKQKIFSLILGALAGLALFFLASSLFGTNASSSISKFNTNQFNTFKRNNTGLSNGSSLRTGGIFNGSGNIGNFTGSKGHITGNSNFQTGGTTNFSGYKPLMIKRGNRSETMIKNVQQ